MTVWTKPVIDRFIQLFADPAKHNYKTIAGILSSEFGVEINKNMAIGIGKRLNMPLRKKRGRPRKQEVRIEHRNKPRAVQPSKTTANVGIAYKAPPATGVGRLTLLQLRHSSCRWPFGEQAPFLFCGNPSASNSPYCPDHHALSCPGARR